MNYNDGLFVMFDTNGMTALLLVVTRKCMQCPPTVSTTLKKYNLSVFIHEIFFYVVRGLWFTAMCVSVCELCVVVIFISFIMS